MSNELLQTLCEPCSPAFAVQSTQDCSNPSESAQTRQGVTSQSENNPSDIVRKIPLRNGGFALIDESDYALVSAHKWRRSNHGYAFSSKGVLMHRMILGIHGLPRAVEADHINHDKLDNRRSNLRIASRSVNFQNRRKFGGGHHQYKGVRRSANGQRWLARIYRNGAPVLLGTHDTAEQAAAAYDKAALALFGPGALLNFAAPSPAPFLSPENAPVNTSAILPYKTPVAVQWGENPTSIQVNNL